MKAAETQDKDRFIQNAQQTKELAMSTASTLLDLANNPNLSAADKAELQTLANRIKDKATKLIIAAKAVYDVYVIL